MGEALNRPRQSACAGIAEPRWLGDVARHLYAALHRAGEPGARLGVLLAPPLFHEQPRSRRLLMEVAVGLAAMGLPSMRFDYFGTGDSAGCSDQVDFSSMCLDLELAADALRTQAGVDRVAVLAWRGAALPVAHWLRDAGAKPLVVLWEPVVDGVRWLEELARDDALERCSADRYRLVRRRAGATGDRCLMGVAVSSRLRGDIGGARMAGARALGGSRCWAVLRPGCDPPDLALERVFDLPADSPTFGGSSRMDAGLFVTPQLKRIADELGHALLLEAG